MHKCKLENQSKKHRHTTTCEDQLSMKFQIYLKKLNRENQTKVNEQGQHQ